jgi:PAS domain S-box-containing protein
LQDIVSKELQSGILEILENSFQGKEAVSFELPFFSNDLNRVDVLFTPIRHFDTHGQARGLLCIGQDISKRKQMEVEKTRVAQELQTFIDTTNAPIFGIDANGLVNEWNNKSASIMGFARSEVLGRNLVSEFITPEYQTQVQGVLDNALQGREVANFEFPVYTKSQQRVDVLLNATTRRDFGGNVVGVLCIGQDITERKQVEVEKTRVAQELQTFIDTANAPIFGIDANGLVNEWNNKSAAITGFSREEVLGKDLVQDFITQEYQVSVQEVLDNALHGRETANFEFPLYTKDQRRVEVLLNATTRRDVSGNVVGVLGVGQDITERKQVEVEKTRVAQELQSFIDTANAPIFGIDADGLVNEWNNKAAKITGFSRAEVLGRNLVQVKQTWVQLT